MKSVYLVILLSFVFLAGCSDDEKKDNSSSKASESKPAAVTPEPTVVQEPATEPAAEEPVAQEPAATQEPIAEKPAVEEPAPSQEPTTQEPTPEEPVVQDSELNKEILRETKAAERQIIYDKENDMLLIPSPKKSYISNTYPPPVDVGGQSSIFSQQLIQDARNAGWRVEQDDLGNTYLFTKPKIETNERITPKTSELTSQETKTNELVNQMTGKNQLVSELLKVAQQSGWKIEKTATGDIVIHPE